MLSLLCSCVSPGCGCPVPPPRAAGSSTLYPSCTLEGMGLAPSHAPMGSRELADAVSIPPCCAGAGGNQLYQDWEGLCPAFRCLGHSASLCWDSITFKQLGEILRRLEKCSKSIG